MNRYFNVSINESVPIQTGFAKNHSLLINFLRTSPADEYNFTFLNDNNFSNLSFTFISNIELDCYFKFIKTNGKLKYVGFRQIKDSEQNVDITNCSSFTIIIPRNKNEEIKTMLTLNEIKLS